MTVQAILRPRTAAIAVLVLLAAVLVAPSARAAAKITEVVSPGGINAWLVEEHSIPMLALEITFLGGAALDPAGKDGLANLLSGLLDEGAGELDSFAFQERLEDLAISLFFEAGRDTVNGSLRTLTENRDEAFRLLGLSLTQPRFDDEPVERIRGQILTGLSRAKEDPNRIIGKTFFQEAFSGHAYARSVRGSEESVSAVAADDLRAFVRTRFALDNMIIGVVGDITPDALGRLLDSALLALPQTAVPYDVPETQFANTGETLIVRKEIPQSVVLWGLAGIKRDDPDYFAAVLLNHVLGGGGFSSRLYDEIREKRGLAYSVYSSIYPMQKAGLFLGGVGTANERVAESLAIVREQIEDIAENGITAEELEAAKTYVTGSFPLRLNSNTRIANTLIGLQIFDLGIDYLERRSDIIHLVTLKDVRRMAERLFRADEMLTIIVGDPVGIEGARDIEAEP